MKPFTYHGKCIRNGNHPLIHLVAEALNDLETDKVGHSSAVTLTKISKLYRSFFDGNPSPGFSKEFGFNANIVRVSPDTYVPLMDKHLLSMCSYYALMRRLPKWSARNRALMRKRRRDELEMEHRVIRPEDHRAVPGEPGDIEIRWTTNGQQWQVFTVSQFEAGKIISELGKAIATIGNDYECIREKQLKIDVE